MTAGHELVEHTGDWALLVRASTPEELFGEAVRALFATILDVESVSPSESIRVRVEGAVDAADLLVRFLTELLFLHDARDLLFRDATVVELGTGSIEALARGERFDPSRHAIERQVKAVTYHRARVERSDDGWIAEVVLDL